MLAARHAGALGAAHVATYQALFEAERQEVYPVIDAFEARMGYALERDRLEASGRVLACPMKKHAPNWQHGRVLYAATRRYLDTSREPDVSVLDVGTAKGFSALCLLWALTDAGRNGSVVSVDVIDPHGRVPRNTMADPAGRLTLTEILEPWPETRAIRFVQSTGIDWLRRSQDRVHVAFIDGTHTGQSVAIEGRLISARQAPGDLAIFDDVNKAGIGAAVAGLEDVYTMERIDLKPGIARSYALGVRRG
jgi:predicted O-methyltransferase YrrM